jgi:beta-lactamase regulating signal transducer with metallopeptidase domain/predicted  nucleic acid-binding Zn-ribbon protein
LAQSDAPSTPFRSLHETATELSTSPIPGAAQQPSAGPRLPGWPTWLLAIWAAGSATLLTRLGVGLWRMAGIVRRARPINDPTWLDLLHEASQRVGCRRQLRLLVAADVEMPATVGVLFPAVVLPLHADTWLLDRRRAVLLHELVHVSRLDWPVRVVARLARAVYWFNPIAWWAVKRLDLEQELACDEEVLALGTRASSYACHLLGIARSATRCPAPAVSGLAMARSSNLEERIMTILKKTTHRRVGLSLLVPAAVLVAAMVPALATVYPADPEPRPASSEVKKILAEMQEAEARLEPHLAELESLEVELAPQLEIIEQIEADMDLTAFEDIEREMQPYLARIDEISDRMEPVQERLEELGRVLEKRIIHVEDGTLEQIERQIHEQMDVHHEVMERIHQEMQPYLEQIESVHAEMEHLHQKMATVHDNMEPIHVEMDRIHEQMAPFHEQMEAAHQEMQPIHEELERLGDRLERAIAADVEVVLREHLGPVTGPGAPFTEAARRITENAHLIVRDELVKIDASRSESREILSDLLSPHRIGGQEAFDSALNAAVDALSPLEIRVD